MRFNSDCNIERGSMDQEYPVPRPYYPTPSQQIPAVKPELALVTDKPLPANLTANPPELPTAGVMSAKAEGTRPMPKFAVESDKKPAAMEWAVLGFVTIIIFGSICVMIWATWAGYFGS